jgi:sigma-B regulation protein RsbU (phosphoserine phosphatase)
LKTKGLPIGLMPNASYDTQTVAVPRGARFYLSSDGAYEVERTGGDTMTFAELVEFMSTPSTESESDLDRLYPYLMSLHGREGLDDDFSILRIDF